MPVFDSGVFDSGTFEAGTVFVRTAGDSIDSISESVSRPSTAFSRTVSQTLGAISEGISQGGTIFRQLGDAIGSIIDSPHWPVTPVLLEALDEALTDVPESEISIRYDGFDITSLVEMGKTKFRTGVNALPGPCVIQVRDENRELDFVTGKNLSLDVDGQRKWDGFVTAVRRGYYFNGIPENDIERAARYIQIEGIDVNVLFDKRFLVDPHHPTQVELKSYPAGTADNEILLYYMQNYLQLEDDFITRFAIEHVGTPETDCGTNHNCIGGSAGWSWGDFMREMSRNIGSVFYLDPDRTVVYTDVNSPSSIYGISDDPGAGEVGCQNLEIDYGGETLRNDAMVWGAGQGEDHIVFHRTTNAGSISTHGLWQYGDFRPNIFRQGTVNRIADSAVYGSPQNKRGGKDDRISVRCRVFEHTFRAAQKANVRSAVYGYEDVLPIRIVDISFPTNRHVAYDLQLSHEIDPIWSTLEFWLPKFNIHPEKPTVTWSTPPVPIPTPVGGYPPGTGPLDNCNGSEGIYNLCDSPNVLDVYMFASRGTYPSIESASDILCGKASGAVIGYRRYCADSVNVDFLDPVVISNVYVSQGAYSGVLGDSPTKHMCRSMTVYIDGVPITEMGAGDDDNPLSLVGTGFTPTVGRSVSVACTGGCFWPTAADIARDPFDGNWGTWWVVNGIQVGVDCVNVPDPDIQPGEPPPISWGTGPPTPTEPPTEEETGHCFDSGHGPYLPKSSFLFVGGVFMRPGVDYTEYPYIGKFCIREDIDLLHQTIWFGALFIPELEGGP